jgi:hypothetical protein
MLLFIKKIIIDYLYNFGHFISNFISDLYFIRINSLVMYILSVAFSVILFQFFVTLWGIYFVGILSAIIYGISCIFFNSPKLSDELSVLVSCSFFILKIQINKLEKTQIKFISLNTSHLEEKG